MHLTEYHIAALIDGTLSGAERKRLTSHLASCIVCAEEVGNAVRMLKAVERGQSPAIDAKTRTTAENLTDLREFAGRPKSAPPFVFRYAVAAVIILGVGIVSYLKLRQDEQQQYRGPERSTTLDMVSPTDGATVNSLRPEFRWSLAAGASFYRLYVYSEDGTTQWKFDSPTTAFTPTLDLQLQAGARYLWKAEAVFVDGTRLVSDVHAFTYSP